MKKLFYLIVIIVILGLIVPGCIPVVPPVEQNEPGTLPNKSDVNPGESIQDAINAASPGDTINVAAGTYTEYNILVNKQLTLLGAQADVDPRNSARVWNGAGESRVDANSLGDGFIITADNVVINGFTVINAATGGTFDTAHPGRGIFIVESSYCEVKYNVLYNNTWRGIRIWTDTGSATNNKVHHNLCYTDDSSVGGRVGISVSGPNTHHNIIEYNEGHTIDTTVVPSGDAHNNTIRYNYCYDSQRGISLNWGANNNTVEYNTIENNYEGGISLSGPGGGWSAAHHNIVRNNTLDGNGYGITGGHGIGLSEQTHDNLIEDNTIDNCGDFSINLYKSVDNTIRGNTITNTVNRLGISLWHTCTGNLIEDNYVDGAPEHCIKLGWLCDNNIIRDNEVKNATYHGIFVVESTNTTITGNTVHHNGFDGIKIGSSDDQACTGTVVNWNNIYGNTGFGVNNHHYDGGVLPVLDATCNWWGDDSGPGVVGPGDGDKVSLYVDYNPWLTLSSSLVYTGAPQPETLVVLEATLSGSTSTGRISGMDVDFYLDGNLVGFATTDSDGVARLELGFYAVGVYEVYASTICSLNSGIEYLAVYDLSEGSGFITGGGWIDSPPGAYIVNETLSGKASFGFVSKYKKGQSTPTGNTEFQFKAGNLNFHSDSYDWLVVAGDKAMYKGTGTINGTGEYGFLLSATDSDPDLFRIKIQDKINDNVIYDNKQDGNDGTELGGGQIIIHKGK